MLIVIQIYIHIYLSFLNKYALIRPKQILQVSDFSRSTCSISYYNADVYFYIFEQFAPVTSTYELRRMLRINVNIT